MATAAELIANPNLDIDPITARVAAKTHYDVDELAIFRIGHDDIDKLAITVYDWGGKGRNLVKNMRRFVTEAAFEDSIETTPTFTMTLHDPSWELLNTGALGKQIDINPAGVPGRWYRLDGFQVNDDDITLTFMTRNAVFLSYKKGRQKANRKKMTRAQFIKSLVDEVKRTKIKFFCPQLNKRQKVAKNRHDSASQRARDREPGFTESDNITVKNAKANESQRRVIGKVIQAGLDSNAPDLVTISAIMTVIQESNAGANTGGNPPFTGPFQQNRGDGWPATGDAYKDAKGDGSEGRKSGGYLGMAVAQYKKNPNQDLGMLCQIVQGASPSLNPLNSGFAQECNSHRPEAERAFEAYNGAPAGDTSVEFKKKYEFMVGPPDGPDNENYLAAIYRLAQDVHWSAFWVGDVLHFQSEEDLFKSKARKRLRRNESGVERINFSWDHQKKVEEMTLSVRMDRWIAPVGTVVYFDEGGPAKGKWLIKSIRRSMFDELGEIILKKPMKEKLEIANEVGSRQPDVGSGIPGDVTIDPSAPDLTINDIKPEWTPEQIINKIVLPKARYYGMTNGHTPQSVTQKNAAHSFYTASGNQSDHSGPGSERWAADMGNGSSVPNNAMDALAFHLQAAFGFPFFEDPLAEPYGAVSGNLLNTQDHYFAYQLIYRTTDHWDHVHFGVHRINYPPFGGARP